MRATWTLLLSALYQDLRERLRKRLSMGKNSSSKQNASSNWFVTRCSHGCLHLDLGRVSVKLSPPELKSLITLLGDAYIELCEDEQVQVEFDRSTGEFTH